MKNKTTTLIVALALGACASVSAQSGQTQTRDQRLKQATSLYNQGVTAMHGGKYDIAITSFKEVIRLYPKHTQARRHLLHLLNNRKTLEVGKRKTALKRVTIPAVDLDQSTVQEAITFLNLVVERESKKALAPNFIIQDPTSTFESSNITLRLNRVPAETLLNYIADQANAIVRYDSHAIVLTPRTPRKAEVAEQKLPSIER